METSEISLKKVQKTTTDTLKKLTPTERVAARKKLHETLKKQLQSLKKQLPSIGKKKLTISKLKELISLAKKIKWK